jgi:predicted Zn-dependent protease
MQYQTLAAPQKLRALLSDPSLSPQGNPVHDSMITEALISSGQHSRALTYARRAYAECPAFVNALAAARAALSMNDSALAIHWLSTAEKSQLEKNELPRALAETNFFDVLKSTPGVSPQWFTN